MAHEQVTGSGSRRVAIVGGGLVGALEALFMAQRGYEVDVFESRKDIRAEEHVAGRSINLALSTRGRAALRAVGMEDKVVVQGIRMFGRMIHSLGGERSFIPYGKKGQSILSVDRRKLNECLLSAAEEHPNVHLHFRHKLTHYFPDKDQLEFSVDGGDVSKTASADVVVGCDGAYSTVRQQIMRASRVDFSQVYIPHGYKELSMPPTADGQHAMETNYLHIWPRNEFMMIALPNQDGSFTCTLFATFAIFNRLVDKESLLQFFHVYCPDAVPLIGREKLVEEFFSNPTGNLISVKCSPYNFGGKAVVLGDAAHAMVPFYGQGMNAGFEDCLVLDNLLTEYSGNFDAALDAYSTERYPDASAICDLAMYNYIEMRSLVNSRAFCVRKKLDSILHALMPRAFIPLYTMVAFTQIPYHTVVERRQKQDSAVRVGTISVGLLLVASASFLLHQYSHNISDFFSHIMDSVTLPFNV